MSRQRSKRAITPILATLLLIVIAVAAIVVTYAWIMTYLSNAGRQAGVIMTWANTNYYGTDHDKIDVDVLNKGTSDAHIVQIYIGTSSSTLQNQTSLSLPTVCVSGTTARITVDYDWTPGATYYFKVIAQEQILGPWADQAPVS
jgi:flagellin-like protein